MSKLFAAASLMTFAAVSTASAATQTFGPSSFGPFASGASGSFPIPQFNPALGTLTSVQLFVTGSSAGGSNGIENFSNFAGTASASIGSDVSVSGPASLTVLTFPNTTLSQAVTAYDGALDFAGTSGFTVSGSPSSDSASNTLLSGFGAYIGLGNVSFNYGSSVNTASSSTVSPAFTSSTPPTYGFLATVVYTYDATVPEPTSLGLAGLGALALTARRRRA